MALTKAEKQKLYRERQKAKKLALLGIKAKKDLRQSKAPKQVQIALDTEMQQCLAGKDVVDKVYTSYGPDGFTVVGPGFGPVHFDGNEALVAYSLACGDNYV